MQLPVQWRIITPDLPGYGTNEIYDLPEGIDAVAESLATSIPHDAVLIGWSLGGMVAIEIARQMGGDIDTLILLASTPCFIKKVDWPYGIAPGQIRTMAEQLPGNTQKVLKKFTALSAKGDAFPRRTIRKLRRSAAYGAASTGALISGLDILQDTDLRSAMVELKCRVVMLLGEYDNLIAKGTGPATQVLCPNMKIAYINTGHAPFISQGKLTADMLSQHILAQGQ